MASYDQKFLTGNKARSMLSDVYHEFSLVYAKIDTKADKDHTHLYAGSATVGGPAYYAERLTTATAGATNKPVYFTDGKPAAISYTIDKSVPSNAEFTDYQVTQNNTTSEENYRIIFSANANDSSETSTVRKSTKFLANPSTGVITAPTFKGTLDGNAGSSDKLTTGTVGATNRPVYFKDGVPTLCAYTIGASVPGDAEFTDTWRPVVDALNSTETEYSLSANQGRVLKGLIDTKSDIGHGHLYAGSTTDGGSAKSAVKLDTERSIFGRAFDGTKNVEGNAWVYGYYNSTVASRFSSGGLQVRENGLVENAQTDIGYAPSIGFHWRNVAAGTMVIDSSANFRLLKQDGTRATLDANIIGNVTGNITGNASGSASKLTVNGGSATQPIYFANGVPTACTYALNKTVPADAVFTDTVYTHPTGAGYNHIPAGGSSNQVLRWKSSGVAEWSDDKGTTYTAGSGISISGTIISNSGVRSITTGSTNGTISVNMNGTDTPVAVKGLGSAAYTETSAYATVSHTHSGLKDAAIGTNSIDTDVEENSIYYKSNVSVGAANLFPVSNNANSILCMGRHSSSAYQSQLGFSSNGNIYYRYTNGESLGSTTTWKQIAFTDSIASASSADKLTTPRTISIAGAVTGSIDFDGSKNVTINTEKNHTHDISEIDNFPPSMPANGGTADTATSASKLSSGTVGSTSQPVYFNNGVPTVCTEISAGGDASEALADLQSFLTEVT